MKANFGPERAISGRGRADFRSGLRFWLERPDFGPERSDFGPEGADLGPQRGLRGDGSTDGRTYGRTDGRLEIHPCVLQDIGPLGQKLRNVSPIFSHFSFSLMMKNEFLRRRHDGNSILEGRKSAVNIN